MKGGVKGLTADDPVVIDDDDENPIVIHDIDIQPRKPPRKHPPIPETSTSTEPRKPPRKQPPIPETSTESRKTPRKQPPIPETSTKPLKPPRTMKHHHSTSSSSSSSSVPLPAKFRDLAIKMSGVMSMTYLENPDRKIFLIGEEHESPECRNKGFVPIYDIILPYLRDTPHVDFMLEIDNSDVSDYRARERRSSIMQRLRSQLAPYIPNGDELEKSGLRSRVHWLDSSLPKTFNSNKIENYRLWQQNVPEDIQRADEKIIRLLGRISREQNPSIPLQNALLDFLAQTAPASLKRVIHKIKQTPPQPGWATFYTKIGNSDLREFVHYVVSSILRTYRFSRCTKLSLKTFVDVFMTVYIREAEVNSSVYLLYCLHRFSMDLYACCRLMKAESDWYKHVVIYAGEIHVKSLRQILIASGFTSHTIDLEFNPKCI